jgi:hypothetical protein
VVPYAEATAREHARIWAELEAKGKMSGYYDVIVAATARLRGSAVAIFNRQHFEHVEGLRIIEPNESGETFSHRAASVRPPHAFISSSPNMTTRSR